MLEFIIVSLIIGLILFCVSMYIAIKHDSTFIVVALFAIGYILYTLLYSAFSPTDTDVQKGDAEYVKEHHIEITSNDTIEYDIYRLEWVN